MKARGIFAALLVFLICVLILLNGCSSESDEPATKSWHYPSSLTDNVSPDGQDAQAPRVAMDNRGNTIIVWVQSDGTNNQLFKSEYRNDFWTNPANLADNISPDGQDASKPQVAMDNNGNAIVVWKQSDGSSSRIFKSEYRNKKWTNPASLSDFIGTGSNPQVAMDNNGNAIVVWEDTDYIFISEYRNNIWTNKYIDAGPMNAMWQIIFMALGIEWHPQVAMNNSGNAVIVWQHVYLYGDNNVTFNIPKIEFKNDAWTSPEMLTNNISDPPQFTNNPQVAIDNNGNAVVVWEQSDGTNGQIFKSEYRGGTWTNPANLSDPISPTGQVAFSPQVKMDNNGNAIIVWSQSDGANNQIFKSEYRNGVWKNPASLADNISPDGQDANPYQEASVRMDNNGNAIITWEQFDGTNWQIFKSEYRGGAWTNPANLSDHISPAGQDAYSLSDNQFPFPVFHNPQVAMADNGNAIIVWSQSDGTNYKIFKSEYR